MGKYLPDSATSLSAIKVAEGNAEQYLRWIMNHNLTCEIFDGRLTINCGDGNLIEVNEGDWLVKITIEDISHYYVSNEIDKIWDDADPTKENE